VIHDKEKLDYADREEIILKEMDMVFAERR
jgi:hypothetical protein